MKFKSGQLVRILGCSTATEAKWLDPINSACEKFGINTKLRLAAFIAQVGHESGKLTAVVENLNYSAEGLQKTWPSRFDAATAAACARNPEKIANRVYSSRMGNGSEASGDGWKYRGRGLIQCTGKSNYDAFSQSCGVNAVANPESLSEPNNAALSAAWFWNSKSLNSYADRGDFLSITKRINGGTIGQADRELLYKKALIVLSDDTLPEKDEDVAKKEVEASPATTAPLNEEKTPAARNSSIVEPRSASGDASKYPWNQVTESRSGHAIEIDDTPGSERLCTTHRTGSYWEINQTGTLTHKSVLDSYSLTKEDAFAYIGGGYTQQVKGQAYRQSSGDMIYKTDGKFFVTAPKMQFNTGMLAVSGEINAPRVNAPLFSGMGGGMAFGDMLAKESLVAYNIKKGKAPVIGGSIGFTGSEGAEGSADSLMSNKLNKQAPDGTPWTTNGIKDAAAIAAAAVGIAAAASAVGEILQSNESDENVSRALSSAAAELDAKAAAEEAQTPVFLKHVTFDKPTLLSQSTVVDTPDPTLYVNNYHTIVDHEGVGKLYISNGTEWVPVGDATSANAYTDGVVSDALDTMQNAIVLEGISRAEAIAAQALNVADAIVQEGFARSAAIAAEALARQQAIEQGLLAEAIERGAAVTAEANTRQTDYESLADHITELTASVGNNAAAIQVERQTRADAISAESMSRETLASKVNDSVASLLNEATTRSNETSALSTQLTQLTATTNDNLAVVSSQINALTTADSATASLIAGVISRVSDNESAVTTEIQTRTDAQNALSIKTDAVQAKVDDTYASLVIEQTARASADSANASRIDALVSVVDTNYAAVTSEIQTRADAVGALSAKTDTVQAKVDDSYALIVSEQIARASADSSLSDRIDSLVAKTDASAAAIIVEQNARADADSATASYILTVSAAVGSAQSDASFALTQLSSITSDNVLTKGEKSQVILQYNAIIGEQTTLGAQATALSITTEKTAYDNAITALTTYLNGLSQWNDTTVDTVIDGPTFRTKFLNVYTTKQVLMNKIDDQVKILASSAQSSADGANAAIAIIADDNKLSKGEKSQVILQYNTIIGEQAGLGAQATSFGITTEKTAYDAAVTALTTYLTGLSQWNVVTVDTTIDGPTFRTKFLNVYTAKQTLLNAMDAKAKSVADTAAAAIAIISDDNKLSKGEKSQVILQYNTIIGDQTALDAQATALSITTEKTAYDSAVTALTTYLNGLTSWSDTAVDTTIDGPTFRTKFLNVYTTKQSLMNAIDTKVKTLANNAQDSADDANAAITIISDDNKLSRGEKSSVILQYNTIIGDQTALGAQATSFGITTEKTAYDNAITALTTYLTGLSQWNVVTVDTTIDGPTFRTKFKDVYTAKQTLLNAMDAKAKSVADGAVAAIAIISDDNKLSKGEKSNVILQYNFLTGEQAGLDAQATSFGITTEKTTYDNAITALTAYLNGLSQWNVVTVDTTIDGPTFRTKFNDVYVAKQALINAISAKAKTLADTAKSAADTANNAISAVTNDNILSKIEKPGVIREYDMLVSEQTSLVAQGTAFGISTPKTTYDTAVEALKTYMGALSPAYTDRTTDTTIVGATFKSKFSAVYTAKLALLNAIDNAAKALADSAQDAADAIADQINNGNGSTFESYLTWDFTNTLDGWTVSGGTSTLGATSVTLQSSGTDQYITSVNTLSFSGALYDKIRVRLRRLAGTGWDGTIYYANSAGGAAIHGMVATYRKSVAAPSAALFDDWYVLEFDMSNLSAGGTDWVTSTIKQIRLDLGTNATDKFEIDWISIGRRGSGVSAKNFADVQATADAVADDMGNVKSIYTIKTNANGHVAGIALVSTVLPGGSGTTSSFTVAADQFKVSNGVNASAPFTVNATTGESTFIGKLNVKSATTGARTEILSDVIKVYDSAGTLRVKLGNLA